MKRATKALAALGAVVVIVGATDVKASLLNGLTIQQTPNIQVNKPTTNKGPVVLDSREEINKPTVQKPVAKPQQEQKKTEDTKTETKEEVKQETEENLLAPQEGDLNALGEEVVEASPKYNPGDLDEIKPPTNPAEDNWLTQEIAKQNGVSVSQLTQAHFDKITKLNLSGRNLNSLPKEFYNLFNLVELDLSNNIFSSIPDLRNHDKLVRLDMSGNRLTSVNMNADVSSIQFVDLSNNAIVNAGNLGSFVHIQELDLSNNRMNHVDDLAALKRLRVLNISNNHVSNVNSLRMLNQLEVANLGFNRIVDIQPLANTKTLRELYINNNRLTSLNGLGANHQNLVNLNFSNNQVFDIKPLSNLKNLETLRGDNNVIQTVTPLAECLNLQTLSLDGNQIYDIEDLGRLGNLNTWSIQNQRLRLEPQKALNGDFFVKNPITYMTGHKIDPNHIDDEGTVNRNKIEWKNLKKDQTGFTFTHAQFSGQVDVPVNNWENTAPIISGADNVTFKIGDYPSWDPLTGVRVYDKEDGDLKSQVKISGSVNPNLEGVYNLVYEVTDSDGITTRVERRVEVVKNHIPVIHLDDIVIQAGSKVNVMDGVEATDYEDGDITYKVVNKGEIPTIANTPGDHKIIYEVRDSDNNYARAERNITIVRNNVPVLNGVSDVQIKVGTNFDPKAGVTATDAEDGLLTSAIAIGGTVDTGTPGVYRLQYSVTDRDGNTVRQERTIKVVSNYAPTFTGLDTVTIKAGEDFQWREKVTAHDEEDGNLTSRMRVEGNVDTNVPGTYELTYIVSDKDGNETREVRRIIVKSNEKPIFTGVQDETIDVGTNGYQILAGIQATDKEDKDLTSKIQVKGSVDVNKKGTYPITLSVTDKDGNTTTASKTVTVVSNKPPVINGGGTMINNPSLLPPNHNPGDTGSIATTHTVITEGEKFNPMEGISASDDNDSSVNITVSGKVDTSVPGDYTLTYKAVDSDGNTTVFTRVVTVRSNRAPKIEFIDSKVIKVNEDFNPLKDIEVTDDNDKNLISKVEVDWGAFDNTKPGVYQIVYRVKDSDGNEIKVPRTIIVRDNKAPVFNNVDDIEVDFDSKFDPRFGVYVTDDVDKQEDLTREFKVIGAENIDTAKPGTYKIVYRVSDSEGLVTEHIRTITVKYPSDDKTPVGERPVINGANDAVVYQGDVFDPMQGVTAQDRQDGDITSKIKIIANNINPDQLGLGLVIYEVSDSDDNTSRVTRIVNVVERPDGKTICQTCGARVGSTACCQTTGCKPASPCGKCNTCCPPAPQSNFGNCTPVKGTLPQTGNVALPVGPLAGIGAIFTAALAYLGFRKKD